MSLSKLGGLLRVLPARVVVLVSLWSLPLLLYFVIGVLAIYEAGWLTLIAWSLPCLWLLAWLVSKLWPPPKLEDTAFNQPLTPLEFWTAQDAAAIKVVEQYRHQVSDVDYVSIVDPNRYLRDAQALSQLLAKHYHQENSQYVLRPLTVVEILSVIHLSVEDLEAWLLDNVPGSDLVTVGQIEQLPTLLKAVDIGQSAIFIASAVFNPSKLLAYPLWRKSGRVTVELQNEVIRAFYQRYLRQVSFYLIEMYSGRLRGGSKRYRERFGRMSAAVHTAGGDTSLFKDIDAVSTTIAVMGQVKAGKSSLINALMKDKVAEISVLPATREVQRYDYRLPDANAVITLLDTPGYSEADVTRQQRSETESAAQIADIIVLVMAANSPAKQADVQMVRVLQAQYRQRPHLRPPPIIAVLTRIDVLRPVREWSPPYNWRQPATTKEQSMAQAVAYTRELFGDAISGYACVYTGETHAPDSSVADEVIPLLVGNLSHGHSAAILKAFYKQLSRQRFQQLTQQLTGLFKSVGQSFVP